MQNINMAEVSVLYISTTVVVIHIKLKVAFFCCFDYSIITSVNVIHYWCSGFDNNGIFVSGKTFRTRLTPTLTHTKKKKHTKTQKTRCNTKHIKPKWLMGARAAVCHHWNGAPLFYPKMASRPHVYVQYFAHCSRTTKGYAPGKPYGIRTYRWSVFMLTFIVNILGVSVGGSSNPSLIGPRFTAPKVW